MNYFFCEFLNNNSRKIHGQFTTIRVKTKNMNYRKLSANFHEFISFST